MTQYIDKSAIVAEIEKLQLCTMDEHNNFYSAEAQGEYYGLSKLDSFLETLEVKEIGVDLGDPQGDIGVKWVREEPVSKDLEEAALKYCNEGWKEKEPFDAFKAGAKWMIKKACKFWEREAVSKLENLNEEVGDGEIEYYILGCISEFKKYLEE